MKSENHFKKLRLFLVKLVAKYIFPILAKLAGYEFKIAQTQFELDAVYKLSWDIYGNEFKYINPDEYPGSKYSDKYDKYSVVFICLRKNMVIGTLRLILDSPLGFYLERDFPIVSPHVLRTTIAELSRFVVLKKYRGGTQFVSFGLLQAAIKFNKTKGIMYWYVLMGKRIKKSFDKYGINIEPLAYTALTEQQLQERKLMEEYYKVVNPLPYMVSFI